MQNNNREVQFNNLKKVHRRYNTASKSKKNGKQITNACYRTSEKIPFVTNAYIRESKECKTFIQVPLFGTKV